MPRSRGDQCLVSYPLYASIVSLFRNHQNGNIRPQFHLEFNEYFETVHAGEDHEHPFWPDLINLQYLKSAYDGECYVPNISKEWLDPEAL